MPGDRVPPSVDVARMEERMTSTDSGTDLSGRFLALRGRIHSELLSSIDFSEVGELSRL